MSAEHIYSNWISRKLRAIGVTGFTEESSYRNARPRKRGAVDLRSKRVVCEPCNIEWLGNIEQRFISPFFFELVQGKRTAINEDLQVVLAFWLTRLAMAYEFRDAAYGTPTFFTQSERETFREHAVPPPHTRIWIASDNSGGKFEAHIGSRGRLKTAGDFRDSMFVVTGVIGCFAFQLFSRRWLEDPLTEAQFDLGLRKILEGWELGTIPVWPENPDLIRPWPTLPLQGRPGLKAFADRFFGSEASE